MPEICILKKNAYICNTEKPIKITVMEENSNIEKRRNYRITIIFTDEIIVEKFETQAGAMNTVIKMRDLFSDKFVGGALEERRKEWKVIWTCPKKS